MKSRNDINYTSKTLFSPFNYRIFAFSLIKGKKIQKEDQIDPQ